MKTILTIAVLTLTGTTVFAKGTISCKKITESIAQGYEIKASGKNAIILIKGQKVADLVLVDSKISPGGDLKSAFRYSQNVVNGYSLEITTGGLAGLTEATVYHGGVAGFMPIAQLNDCK